MSEFGWPWPVLRQVRLWWPWKDPQWAASGPTDTSYVFQWKGLILNPLLLGSIAWLAILGYPWLVIEARRRWRRRRGLCVQCAYPLMGAATCPECGRVATAAPR